MIIEHHESHIQLRVQEYPKIGDQLDAIYKALKALRNQGFLLPKETCEWINQLDQIKDKYPKESKCE